MRGHVCAQRRWSQWELSQQEITAEDNLKGRRVMYCGQRESLLLVFLRRGGRLSLWKARRRRIAERDTDSRQQGRDPQKGGAESWSTPRGSEGSGLDGRWGAGQCCWERCLRIWVDAHVVWGARGEGGR